MYLYMFNSRLGHKNIKIKSNNEDYARQQLSLRYNIYKKDWILVSRVKV